MRVICDVADSKMKSRGPKKSRSNRKPLSDYPGGCDGARILQQNAERVAKTHPEMPPNATAMPKRRAADRTADTKACGEECAPCKASWCPKLQKHIYY